ncbi:hypothetical protein SAMN04244573_04442 [Azotobacter beijerinckii]|uniref:Uncharacterized protein n=2 Tax=Azotobacter beijerinckii TaxID=170623 RepID=A0A1H9SI21_9GAMM|nr:hypothetical protein SAMN04244573_04442 [Azotobacter beijerinckii]
MGSRKVGFMLDEAVLCASSPEYVYDWLKTRAINSINAGGVSSISLRHRLLEGGDYELEEALLLRNDPLIEIGLARFCINENVARKLFAKSIDYDRAGVSKSHARSIRIGLLYNQWIMFGECLGGDEIDDLLENATKEELAAICENPNPSDDSLLLALIEKVASKSSSLSDEKKVAVIYALSKNKIFSASVRFGELNDEINVYRTLEALWGLVKTLPAEKVFAAALVDFLYNLEPIREVFSFDEIMEICERWKPDSERVHHSKYLTNFELVRVYIAKNAFHSKYVEAETLLNNNDIALRCAAYAHVELTPDLIRGAYELDGGKVLDYISENKSAWSSPGNRDALKSIMSTEDYIYSFTELEDEWAKSHPYYFNYEGRPPSPTIDSLSKEMAAMKRIMIDDHGFVFKLVTLNFAIAVAILVYLLAF